jgi:shikimate kinase
MRSRNTDSIPIFLVGFPATGKSTVGPLLAAKIGRRFVDMDGVIEQEAGATIRELFQTEGEAAFREREAAALRRMATSGPQIIAVGGGAPCFHDNLSVMSQAGLVVCLTATPDEIVARIGEDSSRPLLKGARDLLGEVRRLLEVRRPFYEEAPILVDTTGRLPSQVAAEIAKAVAAWR